MAGKHFADRELLKMYTATPHPRFGNERAWSVIERQQNAYRHGGVVHMHALCGKLAAIKKFIRTNQLEETL